MNMNGIVLVDKPAGISSFGVVARVRRILSQAAGKKVKVGHTGTLDPFATGLMIVVVGEYCKRASEFSKLDKSYVAAMRLGRVSSTGDPEGEATAVSDREPSQQEITEALLYFEGDITQTPPSYSAIKINGVRAYKLARAGQQVDMPSRQVTVHDIKLESYDYPMAIIEADVSSGTYIRTLVQDIGARLEVGAYTAALRRTRVGKYQVEDAIILRDDMAADEISIQQ
jgi:tRNA pseudouridine55 synthase